MISQINFYDVITLELYGGDIVGRYDENGDDSQVAEIMIMVLMIMMMMLFLAMMRLMVMMCGGTDYDNYCNDRTDGKVSDEADVDSIFFS